jgi:outer membrane immunogenic protein
MISTAERTHMKKILMGTAALLGLGLAAPATAADMAARPYTKAPMMAPAPVMNWTGIYIGGHVGAAWNDNDDFGVAGFTGNDRTRFIGGGQIGGDYQFGANWLLGIEANVSAMGDRDVTFTGPGTIASYRNDYLGSVTGRLGYVFGPALLYVKGGLGFTDTQYTLTTAGGVPIAFVNNGSRNDTGYTVGGGGEYMFAPSWSAKIEYQYYNFDNDGRQFVSAPFLAGVDLERDMHTVKFGVNYRFGGAMAGRY